MAFNREDLITWNELAPSLQTILVALQTASTNATNRASKLSDKIDDLYTEIDNRISQYIINNVIPSFSQTVVIQNINNDIEDLDKKFQEHLVTDNPHPNATDFLIHHTSTYYNEGDRVYESSLSMHYILECVKSGITGETKPNFYQILNG